MRTLERLTAGDLADVFRAYRDALRSHQEQINRLNVYPVPDGDTGTNMALTLETVVAAVDEAGPGASMAEVARTISHGSLMGARGNSGVILSQILRGIAEAVRSGDAVDGPTLVAGLRAAADGAYRAVQHPVEGTILTVVRAAAEAAEAAEARYRSESVGSDEPHLVEVLEAARAGAADALARTPELLATLAAAGVVDAGGTGLVLLLDAFLHVADGRPLPEPPEEPAGGGASPTGLRHSAAEPGLEAPAGPGGLRYEVMYLLEAADELVPAFREVWAGIGESVVVVGGEGLWNCHIHTDDIGAAVEAALEAGRPRNIRVSDLWEQVEEERWVREASAGGSLPEPPEEPVRCAIVAVCTGDGIRRIFRSLGVHHVVNGGQSMNPSTEDLLEAIAAAPGDEVVILPNNVNIVAVAEQAAAQAGKPVRVLPTRGIQEGFGALLEHDPEGSADSNVALMADNAARVVAGEVTRAVRDSVCDAGPITMGDYLGLSRQGIEVVAPSVAEAAVGLLDRLVDPERHEVVTVFSGDGSSAADTRRITEWIAEHRPDVSVEVHHGGQPHYPYLLSIE